MARQPRLVLPDALHHLLQRGNNRQPVFVDDEDQARIRGGQIDLGYSPDMVRIALGTPQQRYIRRITGGNTREIWIYLATQSRYERQRADIDGLTVSGPGGTRSVGGSAWISVWQERDFIRYRIEFHNGAVVAIEEPAPEENKK